MIFYRNFINSVLSLYYVVYHCETLQSISLSRVYLHRERVWVYFACPFISILLCKYVTVWEICVCAQAVHYVICSTIYASESNKWTSIWMHAVHALVVMLLVCHPLFQDDIAERSLQIVGVVVVVIVMFAFLLKCLLWLSIFEEISLPVQLIIILSIICQKILSQKETQLNRTFVKTLVIGTFIRSQWSVQRW